MQTIYFIDVDSLHPIRALGDAAEKSPVTYVSRLEPLRLGETRKARVTWVRKLNGAWVTVPPEGRTLTLSLRPRNFPKHLQGRLTATFEGESTADLDETDTVKPVLDIASHTLTQLQATLNALATVEAAGGVTVTPIWPPYTGAANQETQTHLIKQGCLITWNAVGSKSAFTFETTSMLPTILNGTLSTLRAGDADNFERLRYRFSTPTMATCAPTTALDSPAGTVTEITAGDESTHAVVELSITPELTPAGSFYVELASGSTPWLPSDISAHDLSAALNTAASTTGFVVDRLDVSRWQIRFPTTGAQTLPTLVVNARESTSYEGSLEWGDIDDYEGSGSMEVIFEATISQGGQVLQNAREFGIVD